MSVLLLGASGYVGRHYWATLNDGQNVGTHRAHPLPGTIPFDVTAMRLHDALPRGRSVTHGVIMSADTRMDLCKTEPDRTWAVNVDAPKALINQMIELGIKPVFISTDYVFDGKRGQYVETDKPAPITAYGAQKRAVEEFLQGCGTDHLILRFSKVFGHQAHDRTILTDMCESIAQGKNLLCATDQIFTPVHVANVVQFLTAAIANDLSGIYHVSGPDTVSRFELAQMVAQKMGVAANITPCLLQDLGFADLRPQNVSMVNTKLCDATGIVPLHLDACVAAIIQGRSPL